MFSMFMGSKNKEVEKLVRMSISILMADEQSSSADGPQIIKLSRKITKYWLKELPKVAIDQCQPSVLAAFALMAEGTVHADQKDSMDVAIIYSDCAKLVTKETLSKVFSGQLNVSDLMMLQNIAQLANKAGLSFYDEFLEVED